MFLLLTAGALGPMGCQVAPHGERSALRSASVDPDPGDARTLSSALARADLLGEAPQPVASAGGR